MQPKICNSPNFSILFPDTVIPRLKMFVT